VRRKNDVLAIERLSEARQLIWNVARALMTRSPIWDECVLDLEAADAWLAEATTDLTRRRVLNRKGDHPMSSDLRLEVKTVTVKDNAEVLSPPRAEVISELWQGVAFLEEVRTKLNRSVRVSPARTMAGDALSNATTQLILAASLLVPTGLVEIPAALAQSEA
jgi:hypothetical protein